MGCWVNDILAGAVAWFGSQLSTLPASPWEVVAPSTEAEGILSKLAWFFPINEGAQMLALFAAAASAWYGYRAIARLLQMIG